MTRDDFSQTVKDALGKRVGLRCSNPTCRASTAGPHTTSTQFVNLGVASHITAAAAGGPRFDPTLSPTERASIDNAIWLCQSCAKLVDNDSSKYTVGALNTWKIAAEAQAMRDLNGLSAEDFYPQPVSATHTPIPRIDGLTYDEARERLVRAGWQPRRNHWTHANNHDMQYGNGLHYWQKGYHEIIHASGTGLGHCTFAFHDVYGTKLIVVTAGEVIEELNATAYVWNWHFTDSIDA